MNKNKTLFFRKTHKLFVHLIALRSEYHFTYTSASFADADDMLCTTTIQPNKMIEVTTIDVLQKGKENLDSEVTLDVYVLHNKMKRLVGRVSFDLKREKILNPNSSEFYKKGIQQGDGVVDGYLQYKFIALNTAQISEQAYNQSKNHKNEIQIQERSLEVSQEYRRLLTLMEEKDNVIKNMEQQVQKLMNQTKRLNVRDQGAKEQSRFSPISLSIKMKPSNETENKIARLTRQNDILKLKVIKYGQAIERIEKEKKALQEEIQLMNEISLAKKADTSQISALNASIQEKKAYIQQLKKSAQEIGKKEHKNVQIKLEDLPQYSQITRKVQEETADLKLQLRAVGKLDDINIQKETLVDKLKKSILEIDLLKGEIQNLHVYIRKLTDELKILRKNTSSEGILAKIEAIRNQNEKVIEDLRKQGNISAEEQLFLYRRENDLIEIEMLKKDNQEMRTKFEVIRAQMQKRHREDELQIAKLMNKEAEAARERDLYKIQLDEAKASLQRSVVGNKINRQNIGETAQELSKQLNSALKAKDNLQKNLASEKVAFGAWRQKYDALLQESKQKGQQIEKLRSLQISNRSLNQKVNNLNEEIKGYQKKYNQLKSMAKSLETAFRKNKADEKLQPQMMQKLQQFQKIVLSSEKEYLSTQIQVLKDEKEQVIEEYYNNIKKEQQKIDADEFLHQDQKKQMKQNKQQELSRIKDIKLSQIDAKLNQFNVKKVELQNKAAQTKSIPLRLATLQKAIRTSTVKQTNIEAQNQQLKQSLAKLKEADTIKSQQLKQSQSKLVGSGLISGVQAQAAIQQRRQKLYEQFNRINDSNKVKLKAAINENNELKIKISSLESAIQRQKMDFIREKKAIEATMREKEREMEVQRIQRNNAETLKTKKIETYEVEIAKLKEEKAQLQECCTRLSEQLTQVSSFNDKNAQKVIELTADVERLRGAIDQSNKGMDLMMATLDEVRKGEQQKVAAMQLLLQQRSQTFIKIEKIKDNQISQLKRLINQMEYKLEIETYEAIKMKQANTALNQQLTAIINEKNAIEEGAKLQQINMKKEIQQNEQKVLMLQEVNQQMEQQLLSLAQDYQKVQQEGALFRIRIDTLQKQNKVYAGLQSKIVAVQSARQKDRQQMSYLMADKKQQLQKYSTQLLLLQQRFKLLAQENRKMTEQTVIYQTEAQRAKERLNEKSLEVIAMAEQKSLVNIEKARREAELEDALKRNKELEKEIQNLKEQVAELVEQINIEKQKKLHHKESQNRISRHASIDDMLIPKQAPSINIAPLPQQKPKEANSFPIQRALSLGKIQVIEEDIMDQVPSQNPNQQESQAHDNLETKSVRSDRSNISKKSALSRVSRRRDSPHYHMRTPQMVEISNQKQEWQEREAELLRILGDLQGQRDGLLISLNEMKAQLQGLRAQQSQRHGNDNIKIDDSVGQSAAFSLGKANILDSRELNNTHQATEKDHSKEMQSFELLLEQAQRAKEALKTQLQQQCQNVEKLIKASEQLQQQRDDLILQLEQARKYCDERMIETEQLKREHQQKVEQLIAEIMQKENGLSNALRELQQCQERLQHAQQLISNNQMVLEQKERETAELHKTIKKIKGQYRKYEEEAQLEILTLKEKFDQLANVAEQKNEDIQELVEKYLNLEQVRKKQEERTKKLQAELGKVTHQLLLLQQDNNKIGVEREEFSEARKKMARRVHQLQVQLLNQNQKLAEAGKATTLILTKGNIRVEALEQQVTDARTKLQQKQRIILSLKNQIALYNDQCSQLKKANDELDYQLQRATKELKDIMVSYQKEFEAVGKEKLAILQGTQQYEVILKEKQKKLSQMRTQMRQSERQRVKAENELKETRDQYQRYKNVKGREFNDKCTQLQLTKNQLEVLKTTNSKLTQQNRLLQTQLQEQKQRGKIIYDEYRVKMSKYQEYLEQVSKQITLLSDRPSKQSWEQALFQNQLFRNRVEELEEQARKKAAGNEDLVTVQFRKYKVKSETVIRNLEQEMESYSSKINELQEANYYLKRENEALRVQMHRLNQAKEDLDEQIRCLQDDVTELKEEVQFYKGRRKQELSKLLNDTDN